MKSVGAPLLAGFARSGDFDFLCVPCGEEFLDLLY
jgi:hypothetical protein